YISPAVAALARPGEPLPLPKDVWHRFARVLRLPPGTAVTVFDGRGNAIHGTLDAQPFSCLKDVRLEHIPRLLPPLWVAQAVSRGPLLQEVARRCTELGANRFFWFHCQRCKVPPECFSQKQMQHLQSVTRDAARQSGRWHTPDMETLPTPMSFARLLRACEDFSGTVLVGNPNADATLGRFFLDKDPPRTGVLVVVGPEGGLAPEELAALDRVGVRGVRWAPFVLRTESAAAAALAALHAFLSYQKPCKFA
ncbi:MAG: RsmE family RNA methyltransferase, partial [Myxococcota bacterium]